MRDFQIHTNIGIIPRPKKEKAGYFVTRGASTAFFFDLLDKTYKFNQIEQVTFIFSRKEKIHYFEMFDADGHLDSHFKHCEGPMYDYISLLLADTDTAEFEPTLDKLMDYEIIIKLDQDKFVTTRKDFVIIEKQSQVAVEDSAYAHILK